MLNVQYMHCVDSAAVAAAAVAATAAAAAVAPAVAAAAVAVAGAMAGIGPLSSGHASRWHPLRNLKSASCSECQGHRSPL